MPTQDSRPLLEAALAYAQSKKIATLTADPGSYYLPTGRTNVNLYLYFSNLSKLPFALAGTNLYFESGFRPGIWCAHCQNVHFRNINMHALQLPCIQVIRTPERTTAEPL